VSLPEAAPVEALAAWWWTLPRSRPAALRPLAVRELRQRRRQGRMGSDLLHASISRPRRPGAGE